jgi:uncharacterized membrane protein
VCLRLARVRDLAGIEDLLHRQGVTVTGLELARLLRSRPRERVVICATALIGSVETIVGVGVIEPGNNAVAHEPAWVVADQEATEGLETLLHEALVGRARALARTRAA